MENSGVMIDVAGYKVNHIDNINNVGNKQPYTDAYNNSSKKENISHVRPEVAK